jgi:hypothetical protein
MNRSSSPASDLEAAAMRRSVRALVAVANRQGLWEAFQLRPGGSQSWTTAVVLHAMGMAFRACPDLTTVPLLQRSWTRAWDKLSDLRAADGSIGFNSATPSDADSTIWLRRALEQRRRLGTPDPLADHLWMDQADRFIANHLGSNGVHTYTSEDGILNYVGLDASAPSSWLAAHGCVTLNYIALKSELEPLPEDWECPSPLPQPFWWPNLAIGAWLISSAVGFLALDHDLYGLLVGLTDIGSTSSDVHDPLRHVLDLQLPSGLWPPRFTLQVPDHADPTGDLTDYSLLCDTEAALCPDNGIFTSALFTSSLAATRLSRLDR